MLLIVVVVLQLMFVVDFIQYISLAVDIRVARNTPQYTEMIEMLQKKIISGSYDCPYGVQRSVLDDRIRKTASHRKRRYAIKGPGVTGGCCLLLLLFVACCMCC